MTKSLNHFHFSSLIPREIESSPRATHEILLRMSEMRFANIKLISSNLMDWHLKIVVSAIILCFCCILLANWMPIKPLLYGLKESFITQVRNEHLLGVKLKIRPHLNRPGNFNTGLIKIFDIFKKNLDQMNKAIYGYLRYIL